MKSSRKQLRKSKRRNANREKSHSYETLEPRKMLATIYPAFVDGVFTLGNSDPAVANPYPLNFGLLESNPGAARTIYLDVTGHVSTNNLFNHSLRFEPYDTDQTPFFDPPAPPFTPNINDSEITDIQLIWQAVAEDFAPFDVNVVTTVNEALEPTAAQLSRTGFSDNEFGVRVIISRESPFFQGSPGISLMDTFVAATDTPAFVFHRDVGNGITLGIDEIAMTVSHEVGHTLGIAARGLNNFVDHPGTGEGEITSWGPLLGRPFGNNLVQWSDGIYAGSTNTTQDYDIITSAVNAIDFRADDFGDTIPTATDIDFFNGEVFQHGFIGDQDDQDLFRFETGFGDVVVSVFPYAGSENLDIQATIYDEFGNVVAVRDPADNTWANFVGTLDAGVYYVGVDGTGLEGRYSDYGSVGFYTIRADLAPVATGDQVGESGIVADLNHNWQTITLSQDYVDPVIVFGPATNNGTQPLTIRLRNVTENTFEVRIQEYRYLDVVHVDEAVGFVVFEAGTYELPDGTTIRAGNQTQNHLWDSIDISETFDEAPIVLTQVRSFNDVEPVTVRVRNVDDNGFQLRLQEEQALDIFSGGTSQGPLQQLGHAPETVSYIAFETGDGLLGSGTLFDAQRTGTIVDDNTFNFSYGVDFTTAPVLLAGLQSTNGGDTANIRLSQAAGPTAASFFIQEEQSLDLETDHAFEDVGVLALSPGPLFAAVAISPSFLTGSDGGEDSRTDNGDQSRGGDFVNVVRSTATSLASGFSSLDAAYAQLATSSQLGDLAASVELEETANEIASELFRIASDDGNEFKISFEDDA